MNNGSLLVSCVEVVYIAWIVLEEQKMSEKQ